jgi:hypothetical protein
MSVQIVLDEMKGYCSFVPLAHWLQVKDFSKLSSRLGLSRIVWYDLRHERESQDIQKEEKYGAPHARHSA